MRHIFCIPGLGADEKVFSKFNFPGYELHFIKWVRPEKNESISSYAKKIIQQIDSENPILIGVSFGGIMCIEISRIIKTKLIIIISSVKTNSEMPLWMKLSGKLKINKLFPMQSIKIIRPLQNRTLGIVTKEEKELVYNYRKNADLIYSNWAVNAVLNWKNKNAPNNLYHIHGEKDRLFSIKKINPDHTIPNGGHLMIIQKSDEINKCINYILGNKT